MKRRIKKAIKTVRSRLADRPARTSLRQLGDQARARGDWTLAGDFYRRHVQAKPEDFDIWVQLGHAMKETGRYQEAEAAYVAAGRLRPRDADLWLMRGHLARLRGDEASAARCYGMSAEIDGNPQASAERDRSLAAARAPSTLRLTAVSPARRRVGAVLPLSDGRLRGWAVDPDHPHQPARVEVLVDGEPLTAVSADGPVLPDPAGARAFDIDLSGRLDLSRAPALDVRLERTSERLDGGLTRAEASGPLKAWAARFETMDAPGRSRLRARATAQTAASGVDLLVSEIEGADALRSLLKALGRQFSPAWRLFVADRGDDPALGEALIEAGARDARVARLEIARDSSVGFRLRALADLGQAEWILPLGRGVLPEPELVLRLLDTAREDIDLILADVALYGANPASLESFTAGPAWTSRLIDAAVRAEGLVAFRREAACRAGSFNAGTDAPVADLIARVGPAARAAAQVPALLARAPAAGRVSGQPFPAPPDDGRPLAIVVEAAETLDGLRDLLSIARGEAGAGGRVLLVDAHERGDAARRQLQRLGDLAEPLACPRSRAGRALDQGLRIALAGRGVDAAVMVAAGVRPEPGALRRLAARLSATDAAAVAGVITDADGRSEGLGFLVGPGGALAPAWPGRPLAELGWTRRRPRVCSAAALEIAAIAGDAFEAAGGFDPDLAGLWRDIDFCLRLAEGGLAVVVEPEARARRLQHRRSDAEQDRRVRRQWARRLAQDDPFYSPLLSPALDHAPGTLEDPWMAARISRAGAKQDKAAMQPRLTAPPIEVTA